MCICVSVHVFEFVCEWTNEGVLKVSCRPPATQGLLWEQEASTEASLFGLLFCGWPCCTERDTFIKLSLSKCSKPNPLVSSSSIPHFCFTKVHLKSASIWDWKWSILKPILSTSSISLPFFTTSLHYSHLWFSLPLSFSIPSPPSNLVSLYTVLSGHSCYGWRKGGELWISKSHYSILTSLRNSGGEEKEWEASGHLLPQSSYLKYCFMNWFKVMLEQSI